MNFDKLRWSNWAMSHLPRINSKFLSFYCWYFCLSFIDIMKALIFWFNFLFVLEILFISILKRTWDLSEDPNKTATHPFLQFIVYPPFQFLQLSPVLFQFLVLFFFLLRLLFFFNNYIVHPLNYCP